MLNNNNFKQKILFLSFLILVLIVSTNAFASDQEFSYDEIIVKYKEPDTSIKNIKNNIKDKEISNLIINEEENFKSLNSKKKEKIETIKIIQGKEIEENIIKKLNDNSTINETKKTIKEFKEKKKKENVLKLIEELKKNPNIEFVQPNYIYKALSTPNDTLYGSQWHLPKISADTAWDIETGNSNIIIAIIDSGVDYTHEDLADNIWNNTDEVVNAGDSDGNGYTDDIMGWDFYNDDNNPFDDNGHGTHCAGIAAAKTNNNLGVAGICRDCKIMNLKALGATGSGNTNDIASAIIYAADNNASIISLSLGGSIEDTTLKNAVDYAYNKGISIFGAAGNNYSTLITYPAAYKNVIAISATDQNNDKADFSEFATFYNGSWIDLAAPGVTIYSTVPTGACNLCDGSGYLGLQGTSMSTPLVAGLAGLMLSQNNSLTPVNIKETLKSSSDTLSTPTYIGIGIINATRALKTTVNSVSSFNKSFIEQTNQTGTFQIIGTSTSNNFENYSLYYGVSTTANIYPTSWNLITTKTSQVTNNLLHNWNSMGVLNKNIILKLITKQTNNNFSVDYAMLSINNNLTNGFNFSINETGPKTVNILNSNDSKAITIDCKNYSITANGRDYGVKIEGNNITLKNCKINNATNNLYIYNSNNITIINSTIMNSTNGILIEESNNTKIINSTIQNNYIGIYSISNSSINISNNIIKNNDFEGIRIQTNNTIIEFNKFINNNYADININNSNSIIKNTNISNNNFSNSTTCIKIGHPIETNNIINTKIENNNLTATGIFKITDNSNNNSKQYLIYKNNFGKINWTASNFTKNISITKNITFSKDIKIENNSIYFNKTTLNYLNSNFEINSTMNISIYNGSTKNIAGQLGISENSTYCSECTNLTQLNISEIKITTNKIGNYSIKEDILPPTISLRKNQATIAAGNYIKTNCTTYDTNLDTVSFYINFPNGTLFVENNTNNFAQIYQQIPNTLGRYIIYCFANDTLGSQYAVAAYLDVISGENITINISSPLNSTNITSNKLETTLNVSFNKIVNATYSINNVNKTLCTSCNSSSKTINLSSFGSQSIIIYAIDAANQTTSNITSFNLTLDTDNDGTPDSNETDADGDGINNTEDTLIGNESNLNTNLDYLNITINQSSNLSQIFNETLPIEFKKNNDTIVEFNYSFDSNNLTLANITINKFNESIGQIFVKGISLTNTTKTLYLDRANLNANFSSICIKDAIINNISEISQNCTGSSEYLTACPGTNSIYTCAAHTSSSGISQWKVTGLTHSGIKQMCTTSWSCTAWSTCASSTQSRTCTDSNNCNLLDDKPTESQSCTVTPPSSGSPGGSSSSSAPSTPSNYRKELTIEKNETKYTLNPVTKYAFIHNTTKINITVISITSSSVELSLKSSTQRIFINETKTYEIDNFKYEITVDKIAFGAATITTKLLAINNNVDTNSNKIQEEEISTQNLNNENETNNQNNAKTNSAPEVNLEEETKSYQKILLTAGIVSIIIIIVLLIIYLQKKKKKTEYNNLSQRIKSIESNKPFGTNHKKIFDNNSEFSELLNKK